MKIKKITVENYRQFINSSIEFENNISILAGANNSGKTSFIDLIRKIFSNNKGKINIDDLPVTVVKRWIDKFYIDITKILSSDNEKEEKKKEIIKLFSIEDEGLKKFTVMDELSLLIEIEYEDTEDISKFADYLMDLDSDNHSFYFKFLFKININLFSKLLIDNFDQIMDRFEKIPQKVSDESSEPNVLKEESLKNLLVSIYIKSLEEKYYFTDKSYEYVEDVGYKDFQKLFNIYCISANRALDDETSDTSYRLSKKMVNFVSDDEDWIQLLKSLPDEILKPIEDSGIQKSIREKSLNGLDKAIESIAQTNGSRVEKIALDMDINNEDIKVFIRNITTAKYIVEDHYLKESSQGLGYSNMIYMHLELESYLKNLDQSLMNFLIIEEPEAHMHPQMQKVFMKYLHNFFNEREIQGLITTHSSEVIKVSEISNLRVIRKVKTFENEIFDLKKFITDIKGNIVLENFYSLLFNLNFSDVIFADKIIMYEGDTERMYIQHLLSFSEYQKLGEQYISYVQVGGAYAHNYKALVDYLKIQCLVLTDIDYDKDLHNEKDILKSEITNAAIKSFYTDDLEQKKKDLPEKITSKILFDWLSQGGAEKNNIKISFQSGSDHYSRTLEEAMLSKYLSLNVNDSKTREEWKKIRKDHKLKFSIPREDKSYFVRDIINATSNTKTDFMYSVILNKKALEMLPNYINKGLTWLK